MTGADEARILRRRQAGIEGALDAPSAGPGFAPSALLVTVAVSAYPSGALKYYGVRRVRPGGAESEGATPSLTPYGPTFYAANTGGAVPAVGTYVVGVMDEGRWLFNYG